MSVKENIASTGFVLTILTFLMIFPSCSQKDRIPELEDVREVKLEKITSESLLFSVTLLVKNRNDFEVNVRDINAGVYYKEKQFGTVSISDKFIIPSNSSAELTFPVSIATSDIEWLLSGGEDSLEVQILGKATTDALLFSVDVDIDMRHSFPLNEEILSGLGEDALSEKIFKIENAGLKKLGLSKSILFIDFSVSNTYGVPFTLLDYPNTVAINGNNSGSGRLDQPIEVPASGEIIQGKMEVSLDNLSTLASVFGSVLTGKMTYRTSGNLHLKLFNRSFTVPFTYEGDVVTLKD